jgi:divalent metal cation (Fe/Co/Zn/Cd) transporter
VEDECFGIPRGGTIVGIVIGLIIILVGLNLFLQAMYPTWAQIPWWAFFLIIIGALMIIGAIYGMRRRY